jgi:putative tricarboxylic transport membrane protein
MTMKIRAPKDFWSGVMFVAFAAVAILAARGYSLGSSGKMGPGYFPISLGFVLGALGAVLIGRSLAFEGEAVPRIHLWPLAVIAIGVCLFGVMVEPLGLVAALALMIVLTSWAGHEVRLIETLALAAGLVVFSISVFVYALGLSLPIWPDF